MPEWIRPLVVGAGGLVGAAPRYVAGGLVNRVLAPEFPWATLFVNVTGCFAIGSFAALADARGPLGPVGRMF
jgi:fluoride exporter